MRNYEAMILIRPDLTDQERQTAIDQIKLSITNKGGEVQSADIWANKRKLAFDIRSVLTSGGVRKYNEAVFYLANFKVDTQAITQLRNDLKLNDAIIRSMITSKED